MIKEELYNKTVDILVQAYFNDTLQHLNCYACAVGNIVAANCGYEFTKTPSFYYDERLQVKWKDRPYPVNERGWFGAVTENYQYGVIYDEPKKQIESTGYSAPQLNLIERAFESVGHIRDNDKRMFNGLMAVIDALDVIHENTDTTITTSSKNKFSKV